MGKLRIPTSPATRSITEPSTTPVIAIFDITGVDGTFDAEDSIGNPCGSVDPPPIIASVTVASEFGVTVDSEFGVTVDSEFGVTVASEFGVTVASEFGVTVLTKIEPSGPDGLITGFLTISGPATGKVCFVVERERERERDLLPGFEELDSIALAVLSIVLVFVLVVNVSVVFAAAACTRLFVQNVSLLPALRRANIITFDGKSRPLNFFRRGAWASGFLGSFYFLSPVHCVKAIRVRYSFGPLNSLKQSRSPLQSR